MYVFGIRSTQKAPSDLMGKCDGLALFFQNSSLTADGADYADYGFTTKGTKK